MSNLNPLLSTPVTELYADTIDVTPVQVEGWDGEELINDEWSYHQSISYPVGDREITCVVDGHGTIHLVRDDAGRTFDPNDADSVEDYKEATRDEDGAHADALTDDELSELESADNVYEYAGGPMMNYWYPVDIDDAAAAALALSGPLCVVEVDGITGLALTGGGMDLSWEIAEAFCQLGQLPPVHFSDLPAMAWGSDNGAPVRRYVLSAMLRSLEVAAERATYRAERLRQTFADMLTSVQA